MSQPAIKPDLKESLEEYPGAETNNEAQQEEMSRKYIFLTIFSCFCPSYPINIVAFVFSMMAQSHELIHCHWSVECCMPVTLRMQLLRLFQNNIWIDSLERGMNMYRCS
ncbi:transmembrane protein 233 isoform X1 [Stegostoma tigrinum]|uniref:transmembrane protein 233 isoform X1 n=1 Tax=Stegostoma tigrinum TaxID=3053191 RepID=UPI00202B112E|nr:transmembrane protein 233 isoform X1 [Stegostoma tigrinum]